MDTSYVSDGVCHNLDVTMGYASKCPFNRQRETVLHLYHTIKKKYPNMSKLGHDEGDVFLEEPNDDTNRWVCLGERDFRSRYRNPETVEDGVEFNSFALKLIPHYLDLSPLEGISLEARIVFHFECGVNHDEVIADTLLSNSPLSAFAHAAGIGISDLQPQVDVVLDQQASMFARLSVVTRSSFQPSGYENEDLSLLSVCLTVIKTLNGESPEDFIHIYQDLHTQAKKLCDSYVVPDILAPIREAISSSS